MDDIKEAISFLSAIISLITAIISLVAVLKANRK